MTRARCTWPAALVIVVLVLPGVALAQRPADAILREWRAGLANPQCEGAVPRWHRHYDRHVDKLLAGGNSPKLQRFDAVSDALRAAGLPTEYALIPLLESSYDANASSPWGQTGLWQFTASTARRHGLKVSAGEDQRLSPEASTQAAVRYLRSLHRMFRNDWKRTAMAYNAGEGKLLHARRIGSDAGLTGITLAYPDKLHAIACLLLAATPGAAPVSAQRTDDHGGTRRWHTVAEGETVWGIARRYRVPIAALMQANGLYPGSRLRPGQRLALPPSR